jgi:hypothetical protein
VSIDATVVGITRLADGTARLALEQPDRSRCAGQDALVVVNPSPRLNQLLNCHVWGGDGFLMCGNIRIAERIGYTRCRIDNQALAKLGSGR